MNRMIQTAVLCAVLFCCAVAAFADSPYDSPAYKDATKHESKMAKVGDISLNYLDYGGTGPSLIFIPGLNDTAHIYDDFAPRFVSHYHVYAITRRGCGDSDKPATGYDTSARVGDIAGFMDALSIKRAILAGHSLAGDELTVFAGKYPDRVIKLVYFDAAYDRSQGAFAPFATMSAEDTAKLVATAPSTLASFSAYRTFWTAFAAGAWNIGSENNMRDKVTVNPDGTLTEKCTARTTAEFIHSTTNLHADESLVKAPALCYFSTFGDFTKMGAPQSVQDAMVAWQTGAEKAATDQMHAQVIPLPAGTSHYEFIQYPARMYVEMTKFLAEK